MTKSYLDKNGKEAAWDLIRKIVNEPLSRSSLRLENISLDRKGRIEVYAAPCAPSQFEEALGSLDSMGFTNTLTFTGPTGCPFVAVEAHLDNRLLAETLEALYG